MRIVCLIENTSASEKLKVEHGLSLYVENRGERFLIDTGASDKLFFNAERLKTDISGINKVLISHNHFAHIGGLEAIMDVNPNVEIYAKSACLNEYFVKYSLLRVSVGQLCDLYEEHPGSFVLYSSFQEIADGFFAMSNEYPDYSMYSEDKSLFMRKDGKIVRDDFEHEAFFVVFPDGDRQHGCVVISPCSHCGIVNILRTVMMRFPGAPIISVIGGFHLMGSTTKKLCCSVDHVDKTINELMGIDTGTIYTCHCTGLVGYGIMKQRLGDRIQYLQTGEELVF